MLMPTLKKLNVEVSRREMSNLWDFRAFFPFSRSSKRAYVNNHVDIFAKI